MLAGCTEEPSDTADPATKPDRQQWYAMYVLGAKVGHQHTAYFQETRDGRPVTRIDNRTCVVMKRGASRVDMEVFLSDVTDAEGRLIEFSSRVSQGGTVMDTRGRVEGDKLQIETTTLGKTVTSSIPWSTEYGSFNAVEQSLTRNPMQPGEKRTIRALLPVFNQVAAIELAAGKIEPVKLLSGTYDLLRIESATSHPGGQITRDTFWTDRTGQPRRVHSQAMDSELYLTSRDVATDKAGLGQLDFTLDVAVPVDRSLSTPHRTKRVRYRVTLERGDPSGVFVSGPSQQVRSIDPHTAEITVLALRPGEAADQSPAADERPGDADREPGSFIQSDNPAVVALARKAAGDIEDPWEKALALERYVNGYVTQKNYSKAFATAAEVVESREGDCTEHAVLLAALGRASGIPARVAIGLVYQDRKFLFHMWTEVHVGGRWTPIDATLARGGIGAAHLKLAHGSLQGSSAFSAFLPVAQILGRGPKVEILEVE